MSTLDLVTAIINKDATSIESSFNDAMAEKISTRLDDMRTNIAQTMFKSEEPEAVVEEEFVSEEELEEAKKKWKKMCEEGSLSEEDQDEYARLDEISQDLSNRYMKKVLNKAENKSFPTKDDKKKLPKHWRQDVAHDEMHKTLGLKRKEGVTRASNRQITGYYNNHKGNAPAGSAAKKAEKNTGADYREPGDNRPRNVGAVRKVK